MLSKQQIQDFITQGYVRIDQAFPSTLADRCRTILWNDTGCDPDDRATWTKPAGWMAWELRTGAFRTGS